MEEIKPVILLTTTFVTHNIADIFQKDTIERKNLYIKSLNNWLNKTNLNIVMVDNSLQDNTDDIKKLQSSRFELLRFPMKGEDGMQKGYLESKSVLEAVKHSKLINNATHIIKVTGRYFVPDLEKELNNISIETDYIYQNKGRKCEIYGIKKDLINKILDPVLKQKKIYLERYLSKYKKTLDNIHKLPKFKIENTIMGGRNEIRTFL